MNSPKPQDPKTIDWKRYAVRTCITMHPCALCPHGIKLGERYYDGASMRRRAHVHCVAALGGGGAGGGDAA